MSMSVGEPPSRPLVWMGRSKEDISGLPGPVKASFGHRLRLDQQGRPVPDAKALAMFGAGVVELREGFDGNVFRTVYVVSLRKAVYVPHAFMKKSRSGIALPKPDAALIEARLKRADLGCGGLTMDDITFEEGSGDVFADLGFSAVEAGELTVKSTLITAISDTIRQRKLTQKAAALCLTDQPTLSKVLRGRMESVTIDRLATWLTALGRTVEIRVRPFDHRVATGQFVISP